MTGQISRPTRRVCPKPVLVLILLALIAGPLLGLFPVYAAPVDTAPSAVFTVNNIGDGSDANPGDGVCETAAGNGVCTLRAAIEETNALSGADTINFDGSIAVVMPDDPLPALNDPSGGTTIQGNPTWLLGSFAGVDARGLTLVSDGNKLQALLITNFGAEGVRVVGNNNIIGTDGDGLDDDTEGNVISSNGAYGVDIRNGATGNWLAGNLIGLTFDGMGDYGNVLSGVVIYFGAHTNRIGTNGDGTSDELERNVISGNDESGVIIAGSGVEQNTIAGNYIGTNAAGDTAIPNAFSGVFISTGSANNRIGTDGDGTSDELERNVISGNGDDGVYLFNNCTDNVIAGNYIGTNATGDAAIPNDGSGIAITYGSTNNLVGTDGDGTADELERNVISGNDTYGVHLDTSSSGNVIAGNYIGTNAAGDAALSSSSTLYGILITEGSTNNLIGTDADGTSDDLERNLISGNGINGVRIVGTAGNVVAGNYIGTNAAGDAALSNEEDGITIWTSTNNRIGGTTAAERNVISGNGHNGIRLLVTATANLVQGNYIGTDASGSGDLGNGGYGVNLAEGGSVGNTIGGTGSGAGNRIAFNGMAGIRVFEYTPYNRFSYDNSLRGNTIFSNTGLGIDLWPEGVSPNDVGDGDDGPNHLQNYPVLSAAASDGSQILIEGSLNSISNTTFALDFYANSSCDPSGYGEGEFYLGTYTVTTDGSGDVTFSTTLPASVPTGYAATATATDPDGNTSEFSACITTTWCIPVHAANFAWDPPTPLVGQLVTLTGSASGTTPITFTWDLGDGNTAAGAVVQHSYAAAGDYTVIMTATNCTGTAITTEAHILTVISQCEPVQDAAFAWDPPTPLVGQIITLTGSANGSSPITYTWDFGDTTTGAGATVTHTYAATATYIVVMTATNACGQEVVSHTLTVVQEPVCTPVQIVAVTTDTTDCSVSFAAELYGDIPFDYAWAFGDGVTSTLAAPTHAYTASGTYTVTLDVWNCAEQGHDTYTLPVTVACPLPGYKVFLPLVCKNHGG